MPEDRRYLSMDQDDLVLNVHEAYRTARDHLSEWREEARRMFEFYAGRQWDDEDLARMEDERRTAVTFNRAAVLIDAIVGLEIQNRQEVRFIPRNEGDAQVNEVLTGAAEWVRDECDAEYEESESFKDLAICGMGWTETRLTHDEELDGKVLIERTDPFEMYWDPTARRKNLGDARWVLRICEIDKDEAVARWPEIEELGDPAPWDEVGQDTERREHVYPQDAYEKPHEPSNRQVKNKVYVAHYQWWDFEPVWQVRLAGNQEAEEVSDEAFQRLKPRLDAEGAKYVRQKAKVFKEAFIAGSLLLEEKACPCNKSFTLRSMTGKRDRNKNIWYGVMRAMEDPQRWSNKFFSQILHILNTNARGGVMVEKTAVEDPRKFEDNWARPDAIAWMEDRAVAEKKIVPKPLAQYPAGLDKLMESSINGLFDVSGVNLELLGLAGKDQPGILEQQRKQAGVSILAQLFDGLRRYRKEQGRVLLFFITEYLSDGRLIRIVGGDGSEKYVPLVRDEEVLKYDVIVDEAPTSPNQKEKVFGALIEMLPSIAKMGLPLPAELLDYAPIPSSLASKWKELIKGGQDLPPEIREQMQKLQEENQQLKTKQQERMAELQMKGQMQQAEMEGKQRLTVVEMDSDAQARAREIADKRQTQAADFALRQEEAAAEIRLAAEKAQADIDLKWQKLQADTALAEQKIQADSGQKIAEVEAKLKKVVDSQKPMKRRVTVKRDADGFITGADVEEVREKVA